MEEKEAEEGRGKEIEECEEERGRKGKNVE